MAKDKPPCECLTGLDTICRWMGISKWKFYRLVRDGGLPAQRMGGTWVANCTAINAWAAAHKERRRAKGRRASENPRP